jgi:hypothetical protein
MAFDSVLGMAVAIAAGEDIASLGRNPPPLTIPPARRGAFIRSSGPGSRCTKRPMAGWYIAEASAARSPRRKSPTNTGTRRAIFMLAPFSASIVGPSGF